MKYVILKLSTPHADIMYPIIFPEMLVHAEVARRMGHMIGFDTGFGPAEVHSAGFCAAGQGGFYVTEHGSESLRIKRNDDKAEEDTRILNMPRAAQGIWPRGS